MLRIASLHIYPVKGLRGLSLPAVQVERLGLQHDRRWAVLQPDGRVHTQRTLPAMATIDAIPSMDGVRLEAAHYGGVDARPEGNALVLDVWRTKVAAVAANDAASAWVSRVLGTPCTLAYLADPAARAVTPDFARPGDTVSLADGFPLLLTTLASLDALNRELAIPVPMDRFRPNLVVDGAEAWAEDGWGCLRSGPLSFRVVSPCVRCTVTTLDQQTGQALAGREPLKTLARLHRTAEGAITFGCNAIPDGEGRLETGGACEIWPILQR